MNISKAFSKQRQIAPHTLLLVLLSAAIGACSSGSGNDAPTASDTAVEDGPSTDGSTIPNDPASPSPGTPPSHTGELIPPNATLLPLPQPPVTPPPDAESEPVLAEPRTTTITQFAALRDVARDLSDPDNTISDAEFEQGPLPAIITVPDEVDPELNTPPFFPNIANVEVFAGDLLEVVFAPEDAEGELPGMFPSRRPEGSSFDDNFDGTKTLRWRPLESDVGIHEFTITATDPENGQYRTTRTIRIRVNLPSDTSGIENVRPSIDGIRRHVARVNDPVTLYIKVTDRNDTLPKLLINNPPQGTTVTPHPFEDAISIVHFVPATAGVLQLDLQAVDEVDPTLIYDTSISIEVMPESDFLRPGTRLRDLATARDLLFGYAALQSFYERPDGALYADMAGEEFNIVSTENSLKIDFINPLPGKYRWAATDNLVALAKAQDQVVHGHTLVWHRQLPAWIWRSELADREMIMREFIDRVMRRYGTDIPLWDVVNESLEEDGSLRRSVWYQGMGASYIDIAFRQARESVPQATLIYNDYDIAFAGPKSDGMLSLMQQLKDAGTPVDGVGFQLHVFADFDKFDEVRETFQKIADMDLDIYVTELDVSLGEGMTEAQQAKVYEELLSACLDQPRCKAFQIWGFTDMYSWRRNLKPLILDERYQIKPAYLSLQQRLSEN